MKKLTSIFTMKIIGTRVEVMKTINSLTEYVLIDSTDVRIQNRSISEKALNEHKDFFRHVKSH